MAGTIANYVAQRIFFDYDLGLMMCRCFKGRKYPTGFQGSSDPRRQTSIPCEHNEMIGSHVVQESEDCVGKKLGMLTALKRDPDNYIEETYTLMVLGKEEDPHTADPDIRLKLKADGTVLEHKGIEGLTERDSWQAWVDEILEKVAF